MVESGTTVTHKTYIGGAAVVIEVTSTPASSQTIYLLHDHLGSTDVITDASGNVETRYSFDAWGARRNVTWAAYFPTMPAVLWQTALTTRGFTGHEELDEVGLVHMNGRVYDPQLGRFLSADPVVQDATDLQAYNHYAYVRNNPLSQLDPSGFSWIGNIFNSIGNFFSHAFGGIASAFKSIFKNAIFRAVIQIAICAAPGVGAVGCAAAAAGLSLAAGGTPLQAFEAFAMTVVSAGVWGGNAALGDLGRELPDLGGGVHGFLDNAAGSLSGSGLSGDSLTAAIGATRVLVHGVVAGALTVAQGGHFLQGFAAGGAGEAGSEAMQAAGLTNTSDLGVRFSRAAIAGALGGTASVLTGGKFANGATTAAFANLYNDSRDNFLAKPMSQQDFAKMFNDAIAQRGIVFGSADTGPGLAFNPASPPTKNPDGSYDTDGRLAVSGEKGIFLVAPGAGMTLNVMPQFDSKGVYTGAIITPQRPM